MPRIPKPEVRQRRNKPKSHAILDPNAKPGRVPRLPPLGEGQAYHPMTVAWWRDVWRSPMAGEYLPADIHGLYRLAVLVDAFWEKPSTALSAEILKVGQCFGLSPLDRRRLEWEVAKVEEKKQTRAAQVRTADPAVDPRSVLHALG